MTHPFVRVFVALFIAASAIGSSPAAALTATPSSGSVPIGLVILGHEEETRQAVSPALSKAWSTALGVAEHSNPDGLGYPWVDAAAGTLVIAIASPSGQSTFDQWLQVGVVAKGPKPMAYPRPNVPVRVQAVKFSYAQLQHVMDDVTRLTGAGVPDADAILAAGPDFEHNRIVITANRQSAPLLAALAAQFGTEQIAVRVDPSLSPAKPLSRLTDSSPFWGGARINTPTGQQCTSGFAWADATYNYIMTAGHCGPNGGTYSTPYPQTMGSVIASSLENWSTSVGTEYLTYFANDSTYRGDVSLIRLSGTSSAASIYTGAYNSSSSIPVREMWTGAPTAGDQFCTGGSFSGEICGWQVSSVGGSIRGVVSFGNGVWGRGLTKASNGAGQACNQGGDSGAPAYTVRTDGAAAGKGILDAQDVFDCHTIYFTDLDLAYFGLPGSLQTQ